MEELEANGYEGVTFEGIARRTRTSKPVLYRRYSSRAGMVLDAISANAISRPIQVDTGSLRGDVIAVLNTVVARFEAIGIDAFRHLIAEADDDVAGMAQSLSDRSVVPLLRVLLERASLRGEIGHSAIPDRAAALPLALLRYEAIFTRPFDHAVVESVVDDIFLPLVRSYANT
jgi:AcrR family transcriptional regulator